MDVSCVLTGALPVHVHFTPQLHIPTEKQVSELRTQAGRIVSRMKTERSTITAPHKRLKPNLSSLEKDEVHEELKREISTALIAGGIPRDKIDTIKMVFVDLLMEGVELVHAEPGSSIILYLKCESVETLVRLRVMVLTGLLLQLLNEAFQQFIRSQRRMELVVKDEDFNLSLFYLNNVTDKSVCTVNTYFK